MDISPTVLLFIGLLDLFILLVILERLASTAISTRRGAEAAEKLYELLNINLTNDPTEDQLKRIISILESNPSAPGDSRDAQSP